MFIFMLLLLCLIVTIDEGEGSYCMTDCTGYKHQPSLYLRTCCIISNLGQAVTIRGIDTTRYILCPKVQPKSCPKGILYKTRIVYDILIVDNKDCKSLFKDGFDISGAYIVNPDGGTPFEVC